MDELATLSWTLMVQTSGWEHWMDNCEKELVEERTGLKDAEQSR